MNLLMKRLIPVFVLSIILLFTGCDNDKNPVTQNTKTSDELYEAAVIDAMVIERNEISNNLIAIIPENNYLKWSNGYVLVVAWTSHYSSYPVNDTISTWWGETWVTVVPEIKDWFRNNYTSRDYLNERTAQLLGMPLNSTNAYFAELWVKPEDLLRPGYDNEITDKTCGTYFTETISDEYKSWFNNNIIDSYYPPRGVDKYPWTRLGYTYDWGNPYSEIGLSEFIIKKNATIIVNSIKTTQEYL